MMEGIERCAVGTLRGDEGVDAVKAIVEGGIVDDEAIYRSLVGSRDVVVGIDVFDVVWDVVVSKAQEGVALLGGKGEYIGEILGSGVDVEVGRRGGDRGVGGKGGVVFGTGFCHGEFRG